MAEETEVDQNLTTDLNPTSPSAPEPLPAPQANEDEDETDAEAAEVEYRANITNPFEILGVPNNTPLNECKQVWRQLATEYHPDKPGGSVDKMALLNMAMDRIEEMTLATKKAMEGIYKILESSYTKPASRNIFYTNDKSKYDCVKQEVKTLHFTAAGLLQLLLRCGDISWTSNKRPGREFWLAFGEEFPKESGEQYIQVTCVWKSNGGNYTYSI